MATNINNKIVCNEPHANLDSYYGPYDSVEQALQTLNTETVNGVKYTKREIGLTVGIQTSEGIVEYWFKNGTSDNDLVVKSSESSLPQGVKIVMFDKNGTTGGAQNSIITDADGKIVLPECTLEKNNYTFSKWLYNGTQKNPGDIITIGTTTTVQVVWNPLTQNFTVSWSTPQQLTIVGTGDGNVIQPGSELPQGTTIVLTATASDGYNFKEWVNIPTGSQVSNNVLTFVLNDNVSGITANVEMVINLCGILEGDPYFNNQNWGDQIWFTDTRITENRYTTIYAVTPTNTPPRYTIDRETNSFEPVNECTNEIIKNYWTTSPDVLEIINQGTNETRGEFQRQKGKYLFVIYDNNGSIIGKNITIQ